MLSPKQNTSDSIWNIFNQIEEYWLSTEGIIMATNLEAVNNSGYYEHEVIGKHFSMLYPHQEGQALLAYPDFRIALKDGNFKKKIQITRKDKSEYLAKMQIVVTKDASDNDLIKLTIEDYASRKNNAKRLKSHFNSLFHNHFVGVLHVHYPELKITLANIKACEILGDYNIAGKYFSGFLTAYLNGEEFINKIENDIDTDFEVQLIRSDGAIRWANLNYAFFKNDAIIEILLYDITEDKKRIEELEKINKQLDEFVAHISHDLRSPIATMLGLLDLSKNKATTLEQLEKYIDLILDRALYLDNILLDLTTIALNEKTPLSLTPILLDLELESLLHHYKENNPHINFNVTIYQSCKFVSDLKRIKLIVVNLLTNAIKYQNPNEKEPSIRIAVDCDGDQVIIEIEDNGIGIQPDQLNKVYNMFYRATELSSGSGLGLYIVKSTIEKLNGEISLLSSPVCGTLFIVTIPNNHIKVVNQNTKTGSGNRTPL